MLLHLGELVCRGGFALCAGTGVRETQLSALFAFQFQQFRHLWHLLFSIIFPENLCREQDRISSLSAWTWAARSLCWACVGEDCWSCWCQPDKHFQNTRSFNRNITAFPEIGFSLFVRWGKRLVGFVASFGFFTELVLMDEAVAESPEVCEWYLFTALYVLL